MSRNTGDLNTVLHEAAKVDDAKLVIELISQGAEVNALGKNNEMPLHMAAARGGAYSSGGITFQQRSQYWYFF